MKIKLEEKHRMEKLQEGRKYSIKNKNIKKKEEHIS